MPRRFILFSFLLGMVQAQSTTVLSGVFTAAQADRGETTYVASCARCHEGADVDGPSLHGTPFVDRWREDSLATLYNFIRTRMPQDEPGKLPAGAYADIVAFLLRENGYSAGSKELAGEGMTGILLVGKDGPKPLPTNTLVEAVGCLTPGASNAWTLNNTGDLRRLREAAPIAAEDKQRGQAKAAGTQTFRLPNLSDVSASPDALKGNKIMVRGALIRQSAGDRINVLALEPLSASCP